MFEQKINTVSIRVNEESFAVVPFDTHEDAIKAAKQALVALNAGDAMESLTNRLNSVEMALAEEKIRNTTVLRIDGDLLRTLSFTERQRIELDQEPPKVAVIEPVAWGRLNAFGVLNDTTCIKDDAQKWKDAGCNVVPLIDPTDTAKPGVKLWEEKERKAETMDLRQSAPLPKTRHPDLSPGDLITWGYQDEGIIMAITSNADIASEWIKEGKKVFEIQQKPINY